MTRETFSAWLDKYGRAWKSRDAESAAELYSEEGTYQVTPFLEPMRGHQAILEYWTHVARTEEQVQFGYEILALTQELGIARWWASFVIAPQGHKTKLDGILVVALDDKGKCTRLREWWHKQQMLES